MERDHRVVSAGLDQQVSPAPRGVQLVAPHRRQRAQARRLVARKAEPAVEHSGPETERDR